MATQAEVSSRSAASEKLVRCGFNHRWSRVGSCFIVGAMIGTAWQNDAHDGELQSRARMRAVRLVEVVRGG
eukprot:2109584-Pleurochrysis_carterae.AAC.1